MQVRALIAWEPSQHNQHQVVPMQFLRHLYGLAGWGQKGKKSGALAPTAGVSANKAVPKNTADRATKTRNSL